MKNKEEKNNKLPTIYQDFIHLSRYARWLPEEKRRETWEETVNRYINFFSNRIENLDTIQSGDVSLLRDVIYDYIINLSVMPSMRCMMTAGPALDRDNVAGFNCAYTAIEGRGDTLMFQLPELDDFITISLQAPVDFDEIMYILLCGTGVGFSVERQYINNLPVIGQKLDRSLYARKDKNFYGVPKNELSTYERKTRTIHVSDSKYGWASALRILVVEAYNGNFHIRWNTDKVRAAGEPLKTFGGRASGPGPLRDLFSFVLSIFKRAHGRKLTSIELHDIVCKIADSVVVGGVRRSALISLSNLSDSRMRDAKTGSWWIENPQRALANNSVCYTEHPDALTFIREWASLIASKSGERGIFNREAAKQVVASTARRDVDHDFGCNPCSEIILRPRQFCNLSEVVIRPEDTFEDLKKKVEIATILGTLQATLTDFRYLSKKWKDNTEEEALLGVSLTGIMDHPVMSGIDYKQDDFRLKETLRELREVAIETNKVWAEKLGINPSAAITCVKPSGTVSQLVDSASGIHPRWSPTYIRRVRCDKKDPVVGVLIRAGVPYEEDVLKPGDMFVFSFPQESPTDLPTREGVSAIDQLELWKIYAEYWCEHKPSITVYVREEEWLDVGAWCFANRNILSGVSFLPYSDHVYQQAPYEEVNEETFITLKEGMPNSINWEELNETEDQTIGSQELACSGGICESI